MTSCFRTDWKWAVIGCELWKNLQAMVLNQWKHIPSDCCETCNTCQVGSGIAFYHILETDDAGNRLRFQLELEFVQCLANPNYLNFLAQRGYFKDKAFVNYLKYLLYWKEPEYAKYLKYSQCLHMLELLQYEHFRKELVNAQCAKFIEEQQILHWQHYSRKRMHLQQALAEQQQQNSAAGK
ncbi:mediator of RNA polymerase II transcription subunit 31-like [Mustela nigripes]|uniref:mediator of RNA polymerase II transcription subunit 31-like n=1 Tax=Mustela nigripes TaxID=77151 RepID=UPI0028167A96|nr:mediator of RNA polymerase II transcription subunit 31-like [Mustela nigripes]